MTINRQEIQSRGRSKRPASVSKQLILDAAEKVFSEKGYAKATIRAVARTSGISIGGIYLYYGTKEHLYADILHRQLLFFREKIRGLEKEDPVTALESFIGIRVDHAVKEAKLLSRLIKEHDLRIQRTAIREFNMLSRRLIADILRNGIKKGVFKNLDCETTTDMIRHCLRGLILSYISGEVKDMRGQTRVLYEFILNAIRKGTIQPPTGISSFMWAGYGKTALRDLPAS
jgi:AcrR family transcriptional regulator